MSRLVKANTSTRVLVESVHNRHLLTESTKLAAQKNEGGSFIKSCLTKDCKNRKLAAQLSKKIMRSSL